MLHQIGEQAKEVSQEQMIYEHDIAIKQLETRLNSLENIINQIHNDYGVWWNEIE